MATTLNVALDEPAGIMRGVCTVATAGALLVSEMLAPLVGAASVRLTVPCPLAPTATLVMLRATADTLTVVGAVGEEPHRATRLAASSSVANLAARGVTFMGQRYGRCRSSRCAVEHSVDRAIVACPGHWEATRPSSQDDLDGVVCPVVRQGYADAARLDRRSVDRDAQDAAADAVRVQHGDLITRGAVLEGDVEARP